MAGEFARSINGAGTARGRRRRDWDGPPLTTGQQQVLASLVRLSPAVGGDVRAREVAEETGIRLGSVVVILRSLANRRLAVWHAPEQEEDDDVFAPTLAGRVRVRHLGAAA